MSNSNIFLKIFQTLKYLQGKIRYNHSLFLK